MFSGVPPYTPQSRDTTEAVDRTVFEGIRAITPVRRLEIAASASRALHRLSVAGLRRRAALVAKALERLGVRYLLGGSLTSTALDKAGLGA